MALANFTSDSVSQLVAPGTVSSLAHVYSRAGPPACPADTPMSCVNGAPSGNDCCIQNPGFALLAQMWWIDPPTGPVDSWTIHGLWYENYFIIRG